MNGTLSIPKIFAFIQARLGSTRFPNKVFKKIPENGMSLLEHIHSRLIQILPSEQIIFLIPDEDTRLAEYLYERNVQFFQGSLHDVRQRYIDASNQFDADIILRLTGDNPFVDIRAIETIIDTWKLAHFKQKKIDLMYYTPLPLGMGIESFSKEALASIGTHNEERHREHVSLHIKENPKDFTIIKLPSPFPKSIVNIRMTFDEELDYEALLAIYDRCINEYNNTNFGALEIYSLSLENPKLFTKNQSVQQIKFSYPDRDTLKEKSILIVVGHPKTHGFGHWERMNILASVLVIYGYSIEMLFNSEIIIPNTQYCIVDSREDYSSQTFPYPTLRIDELSTKRFHLTSKEILLEHGYIDLLPHPKSFNWKNDPEILICSHFQYSNENLTSNIFQSKYSSEKSILCYAGSLGKDLSETLDDFLIENFPEYRIRRIGGSETSYECIDYRIRVSKKDWWNLLLQCDSFLSYFGQGLMEAMYLRKKVASYSIGEYHSMLSGYIQEIWAVPFIGNCNKILSFSNFNDNYPILKNSAHERILQWLEAQS